MKLSLVLTALALFLSFGAQGAQPAAASSPNKEAQAAYSDITKTFGFVPEFLKAYPESGIAGAWQEMKSVQLNPNTTLSGKDKELIGLAVAAQIPCQYCLYFHTEAAKMNGATQAEISEAVANSAEVRHWSTWLNGINASEPGFKSEVDKTMDFALKQMAKNDKGEKMPEAIEVTDPASAYKDIEATFGFVPGFLKDFPEEGIVGAWKNMKGLLMNPNTALNGKEKDLVSLGVASQIPCHYCTYFHTQAAMKLEKATQQELKEAVAMAALTRHWSTVLNGLQLNEKKFRSEADRILKHARQTMASSKPVKKAK